MKTYNRVRHRVAHIARRIPRRELSLLLGCFHLCVVACIVIGVALPGIRELRGARAGYEAAHEELQGWRERGQRIGAMRSQILSLQREIQELSRTDTNAHGAHSLVRTTAITSGMKLKAFASMETEGAYLCTLEGAFDNAVSFLAASIDTFDSFQMRRLTARTDPSSVDNIELELLIRTPNFQSPSTLSCADDSS